MQPLIILIQYVCENIYICYMTYFLCIDISRFSYTFYYSIIVSNIVVEDMI